MTRRIPALIALTAVLVGFGFAGTATQANADARFKSGEVGHTARI